MRGIATHGEELYNSVWNDDPNSVWRSLIAVTEQGGRIRVLYRGAGQAAGPTFIFAAMSAPNIWEIARSVTYVTGAHALKFGIGDSWGRQYLLERDINSATSYRFNNGVPEPDHDARLAGEPLRRPEGGNGLYVQDKWTMNRLTLSGGLRFDYFNTYFPETPLGPGPLVPTATSRWRSTTGTTGRTCRRGRGGLRPVRQRQDRVRANMGRYVWPATTRSATCSRSWPTR
jgi:hypothetical protein